LQWALAIDEGVKYKEDKVVERVEEKVVPIGRDSYNEYRGDYWMGVLVGEDALWVGSSSPSMWE
jgi:hypothetical protein